jgi:hypothetical protein
MNKSNEEKVESGWTVFSSTDTKLVHMKREGKQF